MVICLEQGTALHMAQLMPLPLTVSCSSKIQIGFTFLVPAHLGSPGKRAVKRVCVFCRINKSEFCALFSALTLLVGLQEEHPASKNLVMRCCCGYLSGARCRLFAYGPADATASPNPIISCLIQIQTGFTFLVPAYPGCRVKYTDIAVRSLTCHTATGTHVPYGITQCYLPPGGGDIPAFIPAEAGTRLSDRGGMQGCPGIVAAVKRV